MKIKKNAERKMCHSQINNTNHIQSSDTPYIKCFSTFSIKLTVNSLFTQLKCPCTTRLIVYIEMVRFVSSSIIWSSWNSISWFKQIHQWWTSCRASNVEYLQIRLCSLRLSFVFWLLLKICLLNIRHSIWILLDGLTLTGGQPWLG